MPNIKTLKPITIPQIHSTQTSIDARALKFWGISPPPLIELIDYPTLKQPCQYRKSLVLFVLVRFIEWLTFALKVANDSHNQFKWRKQAIDVEDNSQPCAAEGVKNIGFITKIKRYSRKPYDRQYEEYVKKSIPWFFHILDWTFAFIFTWIISKVKSGKQPNANKTKNLIICYSISQ
jgi:hypothetical protein